MEEKYIHCSIFLIVGTLLIIASIKRKSYKMEGDEIDINKLRLFLAGSLALLGAILILIFG
ncbi:MAG: hypothetical protein H6568_04480 [Lewinellaceae bacterium]|nr:hypothetical protein [Saprospiraceae bacterium]MCB9311999.1 hypothetical protein [Lewinellaceae bacterium]